MVSHRNFPDSAHAILEPDTRWFPADEAWGEVRGQRSGGIIRRRGNLIVMSIIVVSSKNMVTVPRSPGLHQVCQIEYRTDY